ncbi:MAG: L-seryl-tRNA(Sec) selenium transferase [Candidatus Delongbacteria bacterium]
MTAGNLLKSIPKVDKILGSNEFSQLRQKYKDEILVRLIRMHLDICRSKILKGSLRSVPDNFTADIASKILKSFEPFTKSVVNATGIVMNTGLGRAPLSEKAIERAVEVMSGYCSLEIDIKSGKRGRREDKISELVSIITGAEAATVVNNNAAAVMICINTLSDKKEAIISRGELVEIGGSFRMPDIIRKSGAKMVEVGSTNKTNLSDYESAINKRTGAILKVHTSNYRINGFTEETGLKELAEMAKINAVPLYYDLGGGVFSDLSKFGLPHEPTVSEAVNEGADLFSFSGDKVLGGPQCGIIAGRKDLVEKVKKNPLMRVLRTDKIRLALLEETLKYFMTSDPVASGHITLKMLSEKRVFLRTKAEDLCGKVRKIVPANWMVEVEDVFDQAGSGAMPTEKLEGAAVSIVPHDLSLTKLSEEMRTISEIPVFGYIENEKYYLSLRTIFACDHSKITENLKLIVNKHKK